MGMHPSQTLSLVSRAWCKLHLAMALIGMMKWHSVYRVRGLSS